PSCTHPWMGTTTAGGNASASTASMRVPPPSENVAVISEVKKLSPTRASARSGSRPGGSMGASTKLPIDLCPPGVQFVERPLFFGRERRFRGGNPPAPSRNSDRNAADRQHQRCGRPEKDRVRRDD